ncbi:unnamed protein product [Leptosia nina]|uniref:Uncharacterized protein n=1 Tax=Leptosia nina TaxID=320188 RepID=A0AAV1JLD5_9NEOP
MDPNPQGGDGKTNSQNNFSSYFPPVPSQTFSQTTGNFVKQPNVSNRFEIQQTIVPTNQPSRDLTTPFVSFPPLDKVTSNINNQITSTNQPTTYDGQVYQYNKPATIKQEPQNGNKQPSFGSFKPLEQNKPEANKHQQISTGNNGGEIYEYNKPATSQQTGISSQDFNKKPEDSIQQFAVNQPLQGNTNGEVYQYNKPTLPQTSSTINSVNNERPLQGSEMNQSQTITQLIANVFGEQNQFNEPIESEKKQQIKESEIYEYNKPTSVPNLNVQQPTTSLGNNNAEGQPQNNIFSPNQNKNSSPGITYQQPSSILQSTQTRPTNPSFFPNPVASRFSEAGPSGTQGSSLQQPTTPSFSQITQNVYSQPQGPDNSYFYDKPSKPFRQQFPQSPFNTNSAQRPNVDQSQSLVVNRFNTPSLPLASTSIQSANQLQNNGITQAPTSLASSLTTKPTNQQNNLPSLQTFNPYTQTSQQPGSFANAFASTQSFPTLKPQEQTTFNRPKAEIYEYNKPAGSLPESENNNEQKIETPNGQLRPQTVISVNQGSQTQNTREPVAIQEQSFESPIPDASIGLQSNPSSRPLGSTIIGSPCCKSFQKNQMQVNAVPKPNFNTQAIRQENQREQFDVNRKPPTYDSTGYHY